MFTDEDRMTGGEPQPGDDEPEVEAAPETDPADLTVSEKANLARFLDPPEDVDRERSKKAAQRVVKRYDSDVTSRAPRMQRCKELQKMYAMVAEQKNFPFHNSANIKTSALTGPTLQIESRLYDMVWPATGRVFNVLAGTVDEMPLMHISEEFSNSYVRYKMPNYGLGWRDTVHQMCLYGSGIRRVYWDATLARIDAGPVPLEDFVVAYRFRSHDPSMSDVPRYTMVHHLCLAELEEMAADGHLVNVDKVKDHAGDEDHESQFRDQAGKIDGVTPEPDEDDEDRKRPILEQHFRWKAPDEPETHPAFDGKDHYVYALVDAWSGELLRLSLREEDDPDDLRRFQRQQQAVDEHAAAVREYVAALSAPPPPPQMDPMSGAMIPAPAAPPPPPPGEAPPPPRPVRKRQICFFTHFQCFPSDGFYGLGYGDLLLGITKALNTTINQHADGVTLKNAKPMLMSRQVRMQRGAVSVQPGAVVEIDGPISAIRDSIMFLDPPGNDPSTVPLISLLDGMGDRMTGSADTMSGALPKSNQTAEGVSKLIDQALTPITVLGRTTLLGVSHELTKMWRCWGVFLEDSEIVDIIGNDGNPKRIQISRAIFTPTARLVPAADPRMKTQRLNDYQALYGYVTNNPWVMKDPSVANAMLRALTEMGLAIFPDGEKLLGLIPPPVPPGPPPPPPPVPFWEENARFLNGQPAQVSPGDDNAQHLQGHMQFGQSPEGSMLAPPMKQALEQHIRDTLAAIIRQQMGGMNGNGQQQGPGGPAPPGGPPGGGPPGMAGPAGQPALGGLPGAQAGPPS
jgi:hypothetical protein